MPAIPCGDAVDLDAGVHRRTTTPGAFSGLHVDRVELASGDVVRVHAEDCVAQG